MRRINPLVWDSFFLILRPFCGVNDARLLGPFLLTLLGVGKCCNRSHPLLVKFGPPFCFMGLLTGRIFLSESWTSRTPLLGSHLRPIIGFLLLQFLRLSREHHARDVEWLEVGLFVLNLSHHDVFGWFVKSAFVIASLFFNWVLAWPYFQVSLRDYWFYISIIIWLHHDCGRLGI